MKFDVMVGRTSMLVLLRSQPEAIFWIGTDTKYARIRCLSRNSTAFPLRIIRPAVFLDSGCFLGSLVQRERRSLRIHQLYDTAATRHVHWTAHDFGAILCRPAKRSIEIGCFRVIKPLWRRCLTFGYRHHAAHLLISDSENPVGAHWSHIHVLNDFPAEDFRVEVECGSVIARQEFVPAELAGLRRIVKTHLITRRENRQKGALGISDHGEATD